MLLASNAQQNSRAETYQPEDSSVEKRYGSQSKRAQAIGDLDFRASQSEISLACLDFLTIRLLVLASRAKRTSGRKPPQAIDPPNKEEVYFVLSG